MAVGAMLVTANVRNGWEADIAYFDDPREAGYRWLTGRDAAQCYFARYRNRVEFS